MSMRSICICIQIKIIKFDAGGFSECRSKEVTFLFILSFSGCAGECNACYL